MLWTLWVTTALAGPATTEVVDDTIIGRVSVAAPPDEARRRVSDPAWVSATEGGGTRVAVQGRDGACLLLDAVSPSAILEVRYSTRQCPTADGVRSTLVSSNAFSAYSTSWRVLPEGTGSLVEYRISMVTKLMMPQSWVYGTLRKRVQTLMEKVGGALAR